jgi:hypothetical protein
MKPEDNKPIKTEKTNRKGKLSTRKRRMLADSQKWKPTTSQKLREVYSAKTEWARKLIPKLNKRAEEPEE